MADPNSLPATAMVVARYLEIVAFFGDAELDLRDASFVEGVTTIEGRAAFGNVEMTTDPPRLPPGPGALVAPH